MKKKLSAFLVMSLFLFATAACSNESETSNGDADVEIKMMTGEELEKQNSAKQKDEVLIIDVRSEEEYQAGHIPHAINIFVDEMDGRLSEIEDYKDKPIIVYCNTGKKSGTAAKLLVENGFQDVTDATGVKDYEYELVHYKDIRGAEFQKLIDENKDIVLVDVRPANQVEEEGMIEGAINVPFDAIEENLDELPQDKTIALYCNTGTKSAEAALELESLGYENVINTIEGVKEYTFTLSK